MGQILSLKEKLTILHRDRHMSLREIARSIGKSHEWVRTTLGDAVTPRDKVKSLRAAYVLYKSKGARAVMEKYGVTESYVYKIVRKLEGRK